MAHATVHAVHFKHTHIPHNTSVAALMVLETLFPPHNGVLTLPTISVRFCVCACVADGTHVWSVVAGWMEPEVSEGFFRKGGVAEDNNTNMDIFIHAHTSFPINKYSISLQFTPLCTSRWVRVDGGCRGVTRWVR